MKLPLALLTVAALGATAAAETKVGVVVSGDDAVRRETDHVIAQWLTSHSLAVTATPLNKDGVNTLVNCLVVSDMNCARMVVEARATATSVVGFVEVVAGKRDRTIQISAYWISKRHDVVSLQRTCGHCNETVLAQALESMMGDLSRLAPTLSGRVRVTSDPPGLNATIDNQPIGVTPIVHEATFGSHTIALSRNGRVVGERKIDIVPDTTIDAAVTVQPDPVVVVTQPAPVEVAQRPSRVLPVLLVGTGVAAIVTGSVLYATGGPTGKSYTYRDLKPPGIGIAIGGAAVAIVGALLVMRTGGSGPDVAMTSTGGTVGWAGTF
ncbi:MAG: PEGA domain-containing protein [Deltaproteobacteria bacterium]